MLCVAAPPPAWEVLLPAQVRRLPAELAKIDAYLDDEQFIAPWRQLPRFGPKARHLIAGQTR